MMILRSSKIKMAADLTRRREVAATLLQCYFRGYTIRSKLKQVHKEFEEIVHELDGHDFVVVWRSNKQAISLPLCVTNEVKIQDNKPLHVENDGNDIEDRTLTQDVCDKIDDISALHPTTDNQERLGGTSGIPNDFVHDKVKRNLKQNFDEPLPCEEKSPTNSVKPASLDNNLDPGSGEDNGQGNMTIELPHSVDKQMYKQHSTPVSSGDTEQTDCIEPRRHPLLTDSWMTDKSFDAVSDDTTTSDKDSQQQREQIAMELLWTQQAIESRKNYLRLKKNMTSTKED